MTEITSEVIWPDMGVEINPDSYSSVVEMFEQAFLAYSEKTAYVGLGGSLTYIRHTHVTISAISRRVLGNIGPSAR